MLRIAADESVDGSRAGDGLERRGPESSRPEHILSALGIAIVGLGPWGRNLVRVFSSIDQANLVALCDRDARRLEGGIAGDSGARRTTSFKDVLADERVQAVVLATPPVIHADHSLAALDAGKHVFVEKPVALRSVDAVCLVNKVRSSGRKLMVGHILRYHPALVRMMELVSSGQLGRIRGMHSIRLGTGDVADGETTWWTLAPHDVSAMRAVAEGDVTSVGARFTRSLPSKHRPIRATLRFSTGCAGTIVVSLRAPRKVRRFAVLGTLATAVFDELDPKREIRVYRGGPDQGVPGSDRQRRSVLQLIPVSHEEPLLLEAHHFVSAILNGAPIPTDAAEGSAVVAALEAGYHALRSGADFVPVSAVAKRAGCLRRQGGDSPIFDSVGAGPRQLIEAPGPGPGAPPSVGATAGSSDE